MSDENITLLVVDDNKELVKIIKTYLKRRGFNILAAYTAHEALRIIEESKKKIRLMLLDLMLPDMPGQEVLKLIREMNSDIGIIVITGVKDIQTAVELMKAGADDYITKPFRLGELEEKINNVLYKKALKGYIGESLTAERAIEILNSLECQKKDQLLRFSFKEVNELNEFIKKVRKRKDWDIKDIEIGEEMEVFVGKHEEK